MFKTILIDDEKLALERLGRMLRHFKDTIEIIYETTNSEDAVTKIDLLKPDLVFLDIQMPVNSGFDVLEKTIYKPLVIFTTAYDKYALKAFETNSIDYLLKPIDTGRLKSAIYKLEKFSETGKDKFEKQLKQLISYVRQPKQDRLSVKIGSKIILVDIKDILYFKASEKYVEAYTKDRKHLITNTLSEIEEEFENANLIRIHRSYIVNFNYIDLFERTDTGEYNIRLKEMPGIKLPVSRQLKHRLGL